MTANGSNPEPSPHAWCAFRYCPHDGAREIRMYTAYADANAVRLRLLHTGDQRWRHVSAMYEIPNGWAWTLCNDCPENDRRPAAGE